MRTERGGGMGFLNSDKLIVGYDLGDEYSQISYAYSAGGEVETLSQVAGVHLFNIPTVLCKRYGTNQWLYGREAVRNADNGQGVLVGNLLFLALDGEMVVVDGESFDPAALLTLFVKRSLGLLPKPSEKIMALMITSPVFDRGILELLSRVVEGLGLKTDKVAFQSYGESYYSYMLRQPWELMNSGSVLFEHRGDRIRVYRMEHNRYTTPVVVFVRQEEYILDHIPTDMPGEDDAAAESSPPEGLDAALCHIAKAVCGDAVIGSVYLIGDGFAEEQLKASLRFLCRGRRVFLGNNLFSKGACFGMQEKLERSRAGEGHVFLGSDKLKANVGMRILRNGEDSYYALLDAGMNWYEAERETELYIQDGNELELVITPLAGNSRTGPGRGGRAKVVLDGLPGGITRIHMYLYMKEENCLAVEVEDLGFGEFRPSTGRVWNETVSVYAGEKE